jgi:transketolase
VKSLRQAFGEALVEAGRYNPKVVAVSCDLKVATKSDAFFKAFPERSFEVGIAEANGIGIAAGLALGGYRPFISSFGAFITGKNVEIRTSIAYNKAPVVIVGTHGGMIGPDGATQASIQDISVMRSIPGMKVLQPSTPLECREMVLWAARNEEMVYLRVARNEVPELYAAVNGLDPHIIHQGLDEHPRLLISSGPMLHNCIAAAKRFDDVSVMSVPTIEPIDKEYIRRWGLMTDEMIVVEDHTTRGGLGGAVAECHPDCDLTLVGIDSFVPSGTPQELEEYFGLDVKGIECLLKS